MTICRDYTLLRVCFYSLPSFICVPLRLIGPLSVIYWRAVHVLPRLLRPVHQTNRLSD